MITHTQGKTTKITRACGACRKSRTIEVETARLIAWEQGALIQNAFPDMSADDREILISGMCGACFEALIDGGAE